MIHLQKSIFIANECYFEVGQPYFTSIKVNPTIPVVDMNTVEGIKGGKFNNNILTHELTNQ